jgi:CheY-like chemotaxis protein
MGFPDVTDAARAAESFLEQYAVRGALPEPAAQSDSGPCSTRSSERRIAKPAMKPVLERVLLVEDNGDIRTIVKMALEKVGKLAVCACESGAEALTVLPEFEPQLILLDVMMPDMDGPTVLKRMRERPETAGIAWCFLQPRRRLRKSRCCARWEPSTSSPNRSIR